MNLRSDRNKLRQRKVQIKYDKKDDSTLGESIKSA